MEGEDQIMKSPTKYVLCFMMIVAVGLFASEGHALHELFRSLDLNKDGKIDRNEFSEDMKKEAFSKLDKDKNGVISSEEWENNDDVPELDKKNELFKRMDKNKNKGITFFEFSDYADRHSNINEAFMGLDRNGNNSIEPDEMTVRPLFKWLTIRF
jgi:Ca2+-binding EF-hand superfamily protein